MLPQGHDYQLNLSYYFAHLQNTTGSPVNQGAAWKNMSYNLSEYINNSIYLLIETADGGTGSVIAAGIDNIRITYQ